MPSPSLGALGRLIEDAIGSSAIPFSSSAIGTPDVLLPPGVPFSHFPFAAEA
jgi:hypothetical protein